MPLRFMMLTATRSLSVSSSPILWHKLHNGSNRARLRHIRMPRMVSPVDLK
jgi:hypothetical protein